MESTIFITINDALRLQAKTISRFGGAAGIRDLNGLESAIAQPTMSIFGQYAYKDIFEMGAAYCFHVIKNHPFADGNKRAGLLVSLAFFSKNGIDIRANNQELYTTIMHIAESKIDKQEIALFFRKTAHIRI